MRSVARPEAPKIASALAPRAHVLPRANYRPMPFDDRFGSSVGPYMACLDESGRAVIGLEIGDFHISPRGVCHGAVIAALADLQSLPASFEAGVLDRFTATVSFSLDFIAPARHGEWIELRASLVRATRQFLFTQSLIVDAQERPVARSSGVFKIDPHADDDPEMVVRLLGL